MITPARTRQPASIYIRNLPAQQSVYNSSNVEKARTTYEYDNYAGTNHAGLAARSSISGLDSAYTTTYLYRGNATAMTSYLLSSSGNVTGSVSTYQQYDVAGNIVKAIDARGYAADLYYDDNFGAQDAEARTNSAPPALSAVSKQSYAFPTKVKNALGHEAYTQYDYYLGKPVEVEDTNGVVSSGYYDDVLDRPTKLILAANQGLTVKSQMLFTYNETTRTITTTKDRTVFNDPTPLKSQMVYDQLGRTIETQTYEENNVIHVETRYDALGRVSQVSNPYRTGETIYWTTSSYDDLGRVVAVQTPDTAIVGTAYAGNRVLVTDQAGKQRVSRSNALGQLTDVWEITAQDSSTVATGYLTHYDYDTLDNLTIVQQGQQTRNFTYDSLKRLVSAQNLESGTIIYDYDANGNLWHKTDARQITTTYAYDALNRITTRSYSDATPQVSYSYDTAGIANSKGRLTKVNSSVSTTNYAGYDVLGRATASSQVTNNQTYSMSYEYDLAGNLTREMYPSGRIIEHAYDAAGRIASVSGRKANLANTLYASQINYAPHGAISSLKLGAVTATGEQRWEHTAFNTRLQPVEIGLGSTATTSNLLKLEYQYGVMVNGALNTVLNNGNVQSHKITVGTALALTQTYEYDALNRLIKASETGGGESWTQAFIYDNNQNGSAVGQSGNRRIDNSQSTSNMQRTGAANPTFDLATNRIMSGQGYGYDMTGNLISLPGYSLSYDAENKMSSSTDITNARTTNYNYDGDGRRVGKITVVGTTVLEQAVFVYNAMGQIVAEYNNLPAHSENQTNYLTADMLGTPRVITKADGSIKSRHDYLPFGEEITGNLGGRDTVSQYAVADEVKQKFTSKERDNETGLDYFGARYYMGAQGRFASVDPLIITVERLVDPQRLNLYGYTRNNPLIYIDPSGLDIEDYKIYISGPNRTDYKNNIYITNVDNLGPQDTRNGTLAGAFIALNIEAIVSDGDSPTNYIPLREVYVLDDDDSVVYKKSGNRENPEAGQYKNVGQSQFIFDAPGKPNDGTVAPAALDANVNLAFVVSEKDKRTNKIAEKKLYFRVKLEIRKGVITRQSVGKISEDAFNKLIKKKREKEQGPCR